MHTGQNWAALESHTLCTPQCTSVWAQTALRLTTSLGAVTPMDGALLSVSQHRMRLIWLFKPRHLLRAKLEIESRERVL